MENGKEVVKMKTGGKEKEEVAALGGREGRGEREGRRGSSIDEDRWEEVI